MRVNFNLKNCIISLLLFVAYLWMPSIDAAPEKMLVDGTYTVEYFQIIHHRKGSSQDNNDNTILWPNSVVMTIKFNESSEIYFIDLGLLNKHWGPDPEQLKKEHVARAISYIYPGAQLRIVKHKESRGEYGYVILETPYCVAQPGLARFVRFMAKEEDVLGSYPDTLCWPLYYKHPSS